MQSHRSGQLSTAELELLLNEALATERVRRATIAELTTALAAAREALKNIARQKLRAEMDEEVRDDGDYRRRLRHDDRGRPLRPLHPTTEPAKAEGEPWIFQADNFGAPSHHRAD